MSDDKLHLDRTLDDIIKEKGKGSKKGKKQFNKSKGSFKARKNIGSGKNQDKGFKNRNMKMRQKYNPKNAPSARDKARQLRRNKLNQASRSKGFKGKVRQTDNEREERKERVPTLTNRLKVSNLSSSISNEDLNLLFGNIGSLLECRRDYDEFGRPIGSATVVYEKAGDATKAYEDYNKAELDNNVLILEYVSSSKSENRSKPSNIRKLKVINQDGKKIIDSI